VKGSSKAISAAQLISGSATAAHVHLVGWNVASAYFALYCSASGAGSTTDVQVDGWTISNTAGSTWGRSNVAMALEYCGGSYADNQATSSGAFYDATHSMKDGGGNSWN
jgi:hypothetical protein